MFKNTSDTISTVNSGRVFKIGKYKNVKYEYVLENDPAYVNWMYTKVPDYMNKMTVLL